MKMGIDAEIWITRDVSDRELAQANHKLILSDANTDDTWDIHNPPLRRIDSRSVFHDDFESVTGERPTVQIAWLERLPPRGRGWRVAIACSILRKHFGTEDQLSDDIWLGGDCSQSAFRLVDEWVISELFSMSADDEPWHAPANHPECAGCFMPMQTQWGNLLTLALMCPVCGDRTEIKPKGGR